MLLHNVNMWLFVKSFILGWPNDYIKTLLTFMLLLCRSTHEFTVKYEELQVSLLFLTLCGLCESLMS